MIQLRRKIDIFLRDWKKNPDHKPLIVKGARQIGKTYSIEEFGNKYYANTVTINFILQPEYKTIFESGYQVDSIITATISQQSKLTFSCAPFSRLSRLK